jgi:hypothetical protein
MVVNEKMISDYKTHLANLINSRNSTSHSDLSIKHMELQTELQISILEFLVEHKNEHIFKD